MSVFVHSREFKADVASVFEALSNPERLARWWGPDGFSNTFEVFEFKEGGRWIFTMHGPDGMAFPNQSEFLEIVPNARLRIQHVNGPRFQLSLTLVSIPTGTRLDWEAVFENSEFAEGLREFLEGANEQNLDRLEAELKRGQLSAKLQSAGICVNLPVSDLARSIAFYEGLGFESHPVFKGPDCQCLVVNERIQVMVHTAESLRQFTPKPISDPTIATGVVTCLICAERAQVDALVERAIAEGGATYDLPQDLGFIYTHGFLDPDGHPWRLNWMNPDMPVG